MINNKFQKFCIIIIGIWLIIAGSEIFRTGGWRSRMSDFFSDFSGVHQPLGVALILVGIYIIWLAIGNKKARSDKSSQENNK
jgi:sulfite exporter TauE/SafE